MPHVWERVSKVTRHKGLYHFPLTRPFTNDPAFFLALIEYTPVTGILSLSAAVVSKSMMSCFTSLTLEILLQAIQQKLYLFFVVKVICKKKMHRDVVFQEGTLHLQSVRHTLFSLIASFFSKDYSHTTSWEICLPICRGVCYLSRKSRLDIQTAWCNC